MGRFTTRTMETPMSEHDLPDKELKYPGPTELLNMLLDNLFDTNSTEGSIKAEFGNELGIGIEIDVKFFQFDDEDDDE